MTESDAAIIPETSTTGPSDATLKEVSITEVDVNESGTKVKEASKEDVEGSDQGGKDRIETKITSVTKEEKEETKVSPSRAGRSSSRVRKQVVHYVDNSGVKKDDELPLGKGKGIPLKDIPAVVEGLSTMTGSSEELKGLHRVIFGRPGRKHEVKKNILEFSGLVYPEGEEKQAREKVFDGIGRWTVALVKHVINLFGIDRNGKSSKEDLIDLIIDYLENPQDNGKGIKRKASSAKKSTRAKKKKSKGNTSESEEDEIPSDDESESERYAPRPTKRRSIKPSAKTNSGDSDEEMVEEDDDDDAKIENEDDSVNDSSPVDTEEKKKTDGNMSEDKSNQATEKESVNGEAVPPKEEVVDAASKEEEQPSSTDTSSKNKGVEKDENSNNNNNIPNDAPNGDKTEPEKEASKPTDPEASNINKKDSDLSVSGPTEATPSVSQVSA